MRSKCAARRTPACPGCVSWPGPPLTPDCDGGSCPAAPLVPPPPAKPPAIRPQNMSAWAPPPPTVQPTVQPFCPDPRLASGLDKTAHCRSLRSPGCLGTVRGSGCPSKWNSETPEAKGLSSAVRATRAPPSPAPHNDPSRVSSGCLRSLALGSRCSPSRRWTSRGRPLSAPPRLTSLPSQCPRVRAAYPPRAPSQAPPPTASPRS